MVEVKKVKRYFRWFLFSYILFGISYIAVEILQKYLLSNDILKITDAIDSIIYSSMSTQASKTLIVIYALMLIVAFISFLGLFLFWSKARYLFVFIVVAGLVLPLLHFPLWDFQTVYASSMNEIDSMLGGVLIFLIFWGPPSQLFNKKKFQYSEMDIYQDQQPQIISNSQNHKLKTTLTIAISIAIIAFLSFYYKPILSLSDNVQNAVSKLPGQTKEKQQPELTKDIRALLDKKYPSRTIQTQWFNLETPQSWFVDDNIGWDTNGYVKIAYFMGWHDYNEEDFTFKPFIYINRSNFDMRKEENQHSQIFNFLKHSVRSVTQFKTIAGKECTVMRYSGSKSFNPDSEDKTSDNSDKEDSVTIFFQFSDLSMFGYFWGFKADEDAFWKSMESIQWQK